MKVCVVGLGYIGLPTATLAAAAGHEVIGIDTAARVVESINRGNPHIHEPGLSQLVKEVVRKGTLRAQTNVCDADVFLVAVPTPITDDKCADLSYVRQALLSVVPQLQEGSLFIIESTIPPGCTEDVVIPILQESDLTAGADFYVAHCPERVIPGDIMHELVNNDRVVGGVDPESAERARRFYATFVKGAIYTTGLREAELTKLAENAYRDVNIAFANELATVCERLGVNPWEVIRMANRHPRVNILNPGPGVGGHCIAVDPWFLVEACPREARLIATAREVNDKRPERIANQVATEVLNKCKVDRPVVACLGLTYKADVCDLRGSPSLEVAACLARKGFEIRTCDPYADGKSPFSCLPVEEAVDGADALVLLVDHKEYTELDVEGLKELMRHRIVIDTKGVWNPSSNRDAVASLSKDHPDAGQEAAAREMVDGSWSNSA